nr:hypothetical protein [Vibrio neptunius]
MTNLIDNSYLTGSIDDLGVATLSLNRPDQTQCLQRTGHRTVDRIDSLTLAQRSEVRCLVLSGNGKLLFGRR